MAYTDFYDMYRIDSESGLVYIDTDNTDITRKVVTVDSFTGPLITGEDDKNQHKIWVLNHSLYVHLS